MQALRSRILLPPTSLQNDVQCFSVVEYTGDEALSIRVFPKAVPGIVFQQANGRSALETIATASSEVSVSPLFAYGAGVEPSTMSFAQGSYTSIQVILKPHALNTLLGINASVIGSASVDLAEFSRDLTDQLLTARSDQERITLLTNFLLYQSARAHPRDGLVSESLRLIHRNPAGLRVKDLLEQLAISERQFERRFRQTVGVSPQAYLRVRRFNEAVRLIKTRQYQKLTDIAYALHYHDQSHLIRDIQSFSGMTPKHLAQKEDDYYDEQVGYSYT